MQIGRSIGRSAADAKNALAPRRNPTGVDERAQACGGSLFADGFRPRPTFVIIVFLASLISGCATSPTNPEDQADFAALNDPLEPLNRSVFDVNQYVDRYTLRPTAQAYVDNVPAVVRRGIRNVLNNLNSPLTIANDLLEGHLCRAASAVARLVINSTVGVGGVLDIAGSEMGIPYHESNIGQTLAVWGLPEGPYVMLPLFGPSNGRDSAGLAAEMFVDPTDLSLAAAGLDYLNWSRLVIGAVDDRAGALRELDQLEKSSLDFYAALRTASRQHRTDEIRLSNSPDGIAPGRPFVASCPGASPPITDLGGSHR